MLDDRTAIVACAAWPAFRAAAEFGRLVAQGLLDAAECLPPLAESARRSRPTLDPRGLQTRLAHVLADAAQAETGRRRDAAQAIRAALRPGIAARWPGARLRAAAFAANQGVLRPREVEAVAAVEMGGVEVRKARPGGVAPCTPTGVRRPQTP